MLPEVKFGVRAKFVLSIILALLILGALSAVIMQTVLKSVLLQGLTRDGFTLGENLATAITEPLLTEDVVSLHRMLKEFKSSREDVAYLYVLNQNGEVVASTFEGGFPRGLLNLRGAGVTTIKNERGEHIRDLAIPVLEGKAGELHLGLTEELVRARVSEATRKLMLGITLLLPIAVLVGYAFGNLITTPIKELEVGARALERGELDYRIKLRSRDEFSVLAEAFNSMASELEKNIQEIKRYSCSLEKLVEERTKELLLLQRINNLLNTGASLEEILDEITKGIVKVFGYDACAVHLLKGEDTLVCRSYYMDSALIKKLEELTGKRTDGYEMKLTEDNPISRIVFEREPFLTDDVENLIKYHTQDRKIRVLAKVITKLVPARFGLGIPLISRERVVGVIGIGSRKPLEDSDVTRLMNFASQAGIAVEKAILEERLLEYSRELERKVEERTKQLLHAERLATIGTLASGVAHEINNPITSIMLDAERIRDEMLDEKEVKEIAKGIVKQVERIQRITRSLLMFSRHAEMEAREVDLNQIVEESLNVLKPKLKRVTVEKRLEKLPHVWGDPAQLQQVFVNLILNAVQAMPDGGRLTVITRREGREVVAEVSDTGVGIPEEHLSKIFDPFFTTKKVGEGTGLGLSICLGIVERHNGRIEVKSKVGEGTTFTVCLPLR
jgi:signal transduction histidine kinase/HAMP domain-containing protein